MIKFKRLTIALAALFIASATAWADGTLLTTITASADFQSGSKTFDNIATVTLDGNFYGTTDWDGNGTITVTPAAGVTITSVKFISTVGNTTVEDTTAPFQAVQAYDSNLSHIRYDVDGEKGDYAVDKIEVYGTVSTPLDLTEVTAGKQWKIEAMPAGNVTLNVAYFAKAKLAMSDDAEPVALAPKAKTGLKATTSDAIIEPGTVDLFPTNDPQGTLMYYTSQSATPAPDYDTEGWSKDVPTAEKFAEGNVYVWYYIKGADAVAPETPSDLNTCSDSDISATPLTVKLLAPPTIDVTFAKGYSTHYYEEGLALDKAYDALKFYAVTAVTAEKVTLTEIEAKAVPAKTPFVAYNAGSEALTMAMKQKASAAVTSAAQFKGTAEAKTMTAQSGCYVLRNGDSTPTFRLVEGAGRGWIDLGTASGTRSLGFDFGDGTTGINSLKAEQDAAGDWYDLQGRKLQGAPQRKGAYIHNGKTIIIK